MLEKAEYASYCDRFHKVWSYLKKNSENQDKTIYEICEIRGYEVDRMEGILSKAEFIKLKDDCNTKILKKMGNDLALFSKDDNFLVEGRYLFPVKDMFGNIIAIIGWYPDEKKYITTPSKFFSKTCLFYGMEQIGQTGIGKTYFLTEGIFDSLSIRSLGYNALAMMGIDCSRYKTALYSLFKRVIAIPDIDEQGKKVIKFDKWSLPANSKYFRWSGISPEKVKDIDVFINMFEYDDIYKLLSEIPNEKKRIVTYEF